MLQTILYKRLTTFRRRVSLILIVALAAQTGLPVIPARAAEQPRVLSASPLPAPGTRLVPSAAYRPATLAGLRLDPADPLRMEFLIDTGDDPQSPEEMNGMNARLINYFLAALTVPEDQLWVNLSPEESNRIIADDLVKTEMGRDMLAMDYLLKQLMASLLYPEEGVGSEFWKRVHQQAQRRFGTTDIPTDTFNKIWIVPRQAHVHVQGDHVFIVDSELQVMLEEDYLSLKAHTAETKGEPDGWSEQTKELIREVMIPEISREINTGRHFANLRQIYHAMLLATWYKKNLSDNYVNRIYADRNLVSGIDLAAPGIKEKIYQRYLEAFRKGAFDYIREDLDPVSGEPLPRRYFSGGLKGYDQAMISESASSEDFIDDLGSRNIVRQIVDLRPVPAELPVREAANDRPVSELPAADLSLTKQLRKAHFSYSVYGTVPDGVEYVGVGHSRRVYALPATHPHLVFKMVRVDQDLDPPSPTESLELAELVEQTGYEFVTVDGIQLIKAPGLAPFRYMGGILIQERGRPTQDVGDFNTVLALFEKLGVHWDLAASRRPDAQLKNIALYEETVDGQSRLVPRVTDLKGFFRPKPDQAITAEDQVRLAAMFSELTEQTPFLWRRIWDAANQVAARGQASASPERDAVLAAKLHLMLRTLMSMRELPVLQRNRPVIVYPHVDTSAPAIFYLTVDDILTQLEGHIVHLQKFLAPEKFGPPPEDMLPLPEAVLLLKQQTIRAEAAFSALHNAPSYPLILTGSGYRVFTDLLKRKVSAVDFHNGFTGIITSLGLRPGPVNVGATNLRRIEEKLTRLLRQARQIGHLSPDLDRRMRDSTAELEDEILKDIASLIDIIELRQFPNGDTNRQFVDAVVAATVREKLLDLFAPSLDWNGMKLSEEEEISPDVILSLRNGVGRMREWLEQLSESSGYFFTLDESTSLITARLDPPDTTADRAMLASLDERLKDRFRRLNRAAIMPLHHLTQTARTLHEQLKGMHGTWDETMRDEIVAGLRDVQGRLDGLQLIVTNVSESTGPTEQSEDLRIVRDTVTARVDMLKGAVTQTILEIEDTHDTSPGVQSMKLEIAALMAQELLRFSRFVADAARYDRIPLVREGDSVTVFGEFTDYNNFTRQLRQALGRQTRRYQMRLQVVGSETFELTRLESLISDLDGLNRDFIFAPDPRQQDLVNRFQGKVDEIIDQIDNWADSLDGQSAYSGDEEADRAERIVTHTVRHFLQTRLRPLVAADRSYPVVAYRAQLVQRLQLLLTSLKGRMDLLSTGDGFMFVRDPVDLRVRLGIDPGEILDRGMALRMLFREYLSESADAYEALAGQLNALNEIVAKTNTYVTQDQIVELSEKILFHLAQTHSTPAMLMIGSEFAERDYGTDPQTLMFNTVFHATDVMIRSAQSIAMNVRDPGNTTVPQQTVALIQNFNYFLSVFRLMAEAEAFPLIRTEEGPVVFDEAVNFGLQADDLQRAFQWESIQLGTNALWAGDRSATPFARLEALIDQLQTAVDRWDSDDLLAMFGFGRVFGDVQPEMLSVLDEVARTRFDRRPQGLASREDLVGAIVSNSVSQIVVDRLYGWVQTDSHGFILKEDAENYVRYLRQELRLAAARVNTLARRPDYAFQRHPVSGEISLDVSELLPKGSVDQAALGLGDRLLAAHFRTVEMLGDSPAVTFSDEEVDTLMYMLEGGTGDMLRESTLLSKLIHQINMVFQHEGGVNQLTREWLEILSAQIGVPVARLANLLRWFKFIELDTGSVSHIALSNFFNRYINIVREFPDVYKSFTYYVPPGTGDEKKLSLAAVNMETLTGMFSKNFVNGKSVLKADVPGRDYYIGLEFGVPENGFGLNMVMGVNDPDSDNPFPNVFMRIGLDTQGPDMRINFMQGVAGQEKLINEDFVRLMGFHPGIALLYVAVDLAHQGHVHFVDGELDPMIDPFRTLHGIRPEFIPSLRNRLSRATINIMKGYDDFGLRKKSNFSRFRSVSELVRQLIPQRMAQKDLRARSISRLHEAFLNFKEIPLRQDQAQLSKDQRIAVLELASADMFRFVLSGEPYYPDIPRILARLNLGHHYHNAVRELVALKADEGILGRRFDDGVGFATGSEGVADQAMTGLTPQQKVAVLELVSEQLAVQGEDYRISLNYLLETLGISYDLGTEVYRLIMSAARQGVFSDKEFLPPRPGDQAQLSAAQRIAVLEYVSEKLAMSDGTYNPNFKEILDALSIPRDMAQEVYRWILVNAKAGIFDFSRVEPIPVQRDQAVTAEETKGGIDFNPANLEMRQTGAFAGADANLPLPAQAPAIQGLVPVLIQVTPVTNLPLLLGRVPETSPETAPEAVPVAAPALPADLRLSFLSEK